MANNYKQLKSRMDKQIFRANWARAKLKAVQETFKASKKLTQQSQQRGRFLPMRRIAEELGGDSAAAMRYCKSCIALGASEYYLDVKRSLVRG